MSDPYTDAWLLLAIFYAEGDTTASLDKIIEVGDRIERGVFTFEEFQDSMAKFVSAGFVQPVGHGYRVIGLAHEACEKIARHSSLQQQRGLAEKFVRKNLPTTALSDERKLRLCPMLTRADFDRAEKKYRDAMEKFIREEYGDPSEGK